MDVGLFSLAHSADEARSSPRPRKSFSIALGQQIRRSCQTNCFVLQVANSELLRIKAAGIEAHSRRQQLGFSSDIEHGCSQNL
jgi:hypothetical protein